MFITFEGPNGVGKTTVLDGVLSELLATGLDTIKTKEPTKSSLGEFFKNAEESHRGDCLACLAAADRYFHVEQEIVPALSAGKIVLSDRYVESSLVLQRLDGCDLEFVWNLNSRIPIPDISIILVAEVEILAERLLARRKQLSRFELGEERNKEALFYREAATFIAERGFNVLLLNNGVVPISETITCIVQEIKKLYEKKKERKS